LHSFCRAAVPHCHSAVAELNADAAAAGERHPLRARPPLKPAPDDARAIRDPSSDPNERASTAGRAAHRSEDLLPIDELLEPAPLPAVGGRRAGRQQSMLWRFCRWLPPCRMVVDDVSTTRRHASRHDDSSTRRPASSGALPDPSVRVSETSVAALTSAESLPSGDTPTATSGLAPIGQPRRAEVRREAEQPEPRRAKVDAPISRPDRSRSDCQLAPETSSSRRSSRTDQRLVPVAPAPAVAAPVSHAGETELAGLPEPAPASPRGGQRRRRDCHAGVCAIVAPDGSAFRGFRVTPDGRRFGSEEQIVRAALGRYSPRTTGSTRRRRRTSGPASISAPWRARSRACRRSQFRWAGATFG
jgi:hypothetical protein